MIYYLKRLLNILKLWILLFKVKLNKKLMLCLKMMKSLWFYRQWTIFILCWKSKLLSNWDRDEDVKVDYWVTMNIWIWLWKMLLKQFLKMMLKFLKSISLNCAFCAVTWWWLFRDQRILVKKQIIWLTECFLLIRNSIIKNLTLFF